MKRTKVESSLERQFLTAMITSTPFLAGAANLTDLDLLETKYVAQVAKWCLSHFKKYGEPPNGSLESIYRGWVENEKPEPDEIDAVRDFLDTLTPEEPLPVNAPHLLDQFSTYLTLKKATRLKELLESSLLQGRKEEIVEAIQSFRTVSLNDKAGYNPLSGKDHWTRTFAEPEEPLIHFPGAAGHFFDSALTRDSLIGVQGPEKKGKTNWCLEFMYRALRGRRKVAMFEVGDLSEYQLNKRLAMRIARRPLWQKQCGIPLPIPTGIKIVDGEGGRVAEVDNTYEKFPFPVDRKSAYQGQKKFCRTHKIPDGVPQVMFSIHPNSSINVAGINGILKQWEYELEFVPDVILIDYADILAPENGRLEPRHQVNETWKALRRLSQDWHACVIAPTQSAASAYEVKTQSMKNFSEDKRKFAHCTGVVGLNQTPEEKKIGVMRLNWIIQRESPFETSHCLWVAQAIHIGVALMKSTMG